MPEVKKICFKCKKSNLAYKAFVCANKNTVLFKSENTKYLYCLDCKAEVNWTSHYRAAPKETKLYPKIIRAI